MYTQEAAPEPLAKPTDPLPKAGTPDGSKPAASRFAYDTLTTVVVSKHRRGNFVLDLLGGSASWPLGTLLTCQTVSGAGSSSAGQGRPPDAELKQRLFQQPDEGTADNTASQWQVRQGLLCVCIPPCPAGLLLMQVLVLLLQERVQRDGGSARWESARGGAGGPEEVCQCQGHLL